VSRLQQVLDLFHILSAIKESRLTPKCQLRKEALKLYESVLFHYVTISPYHWYPVLSEIRGRIVVLVPLTIVVPQSQWPLLSAVHLCCALAPPLALACVPGGRCSAMNLHHHGRTPPAFLSFKCCHVGIRAFCPTSCRQQLWRGENSFLGFSNEVCLAGDVQRA
jgi:hypothetical protein